MPLRDHAILCPAIVEYLKAGKRPSWEIEDELARLFNVSKEERSQIYPNSGCPIWTNDVAFALKRLVEDRKIRRDRKTRAPNGGTRGVYGLV